MSKGGTLFTMTYYGSPDGGEELQTSWESPKAALGAPSAILAAELGPKGFACMRSRPARSPRAQASGIRNSTNCSTKQGEAPARCLAASEDVGVATAFLAH